jgi:hypothetical protein
VLGRPTQTIRKPDRLVLGYAVGVFLRSTDTVCTEVLNITFRPGRDAVSVNPSLAQRIVTEFAR